MHNPPALSLNPPAARRVAVLGAGIVGLATAWQLQRDGFDVTVIDAQRPGQGASFGNGAQLSYAYVQPLADPSIWAQLPKLLLSRESPFSLRLRLDPTQWAWGLRFLAACRAEVSARSTGTLLALAEESREALQQLLADTQAHCDFTTSGKLVMYGSEASFAAARRQLDLQRVLGGAEQHALSLADCLRVEPALAGSAARYVGGIHTPGECAADCARLCDALHGALQARGVRFVLGAPVGALRREGDRLVAVQAGSDWIEADGFVAALGTGVAAFARRLGVSLPVYPLKGYSLTLDVPAGGGLAPNVSVTDAQRKLVFARLGQRLRVAGLAELAGHDTRIETHRVEQLRRAAREVFPLACAGTEARPWAGLRPATPTGVPILGRVGGAPANLLFNAGHGALGFTLAAGSARRLSRQWQGVAERPRAAAALIRSAARPAENSA
ncbi:MULTISPECIES: D-amino acid dehydrogenase [unclassified Hydrogenophaga]|uniref:D-amino acid dehydrogenase n=1 Tax=unclassified Hydrogenophaga TaxID=2610897 RepID=UPI0008791BEB|nr:MULTISPECIES: D-amino acid dehydrogenase [unclassified Hydrogenophaga]MBN9372030.1 D-amino acid dehydrogenase [Hydrogenophaga sp.]